MTDADRAVETAHAEQEATRRRHKQERLVLLVSELGADEARRDQFGMRTVNPHRNAQDARARIALARAEADELRSLPAGDAARRIKAKRAEQEQTRQRAAQRARQPDRSSAIPLAPARVARGQHAPYEPRQRAASLSVRRRRQRDVQTRPRRPRQRCSQ